MTGARKQAQSARTARCRMQRPRFARRNDRVMGAMKQEQRTDPQLRDGGQRCDRLRRTGEPALPVTHPENDPLYNRPEVSEMMPAALSHCAPHAGKDSVPGHSLNAGVLGGRQKCHRSAHREAEHPDRKAGRVGSLAQIVDRAA